MAILTALLMLCSAIMIPTLAFKPGQSPISGAAYAVFEGTAASDYYSSMQYSYTINSWAAAANIGYPALGATGNNPGEVYFNAGKSLRLGFTEFGEMATPVNAGIAYGNGTIEWNNTESWAPSVAGIPPAYWIQGWQFAMNYTRIGAPYMMSIEAYALYSNTTTNEVGRGVYSWYGNFTSNSGSSNLTFGRLVPGGVVILYDSARLVVARSTVIIQDGMNQYEDVAAVISTLVFDKDTKYAELYQDVKVLLSFKLLQGISAFSFSDRYELDLAVALNASTSDKSYIHYFANDVNTQSVYQYPLTGTNNTDVIQAFDPNRQYMFFAGYWPNATEYTVYNQLITPELGTGYTGVLPVGTAVADLPATFEEPHIPWITVQWLYNSIQWPNLTSWLAGGEGQMRFVEVPGMTDYNHDPHPALDINASDISNQVDTEVLYLLNQVFNPTSLNSLALNATSPTTLSPVSTFMWTGLGQSAATTDSGAAAMVGGNSGTYATSLALFDRNDTAFPYLSPVVTMQGSIPYGLYSFNGTYSETFNNNAEGTGADTTNYVRTGLNDFALGYNGITDPQPIAGGAGNGTSTYYWYPSKNPLTQRWLYSAGWSMSAYPSVTYNPNGIITLGGPKANGLTRYFNDFDYAIFREGTAGTYDALIHNVTGTVTGSAPTSNPAYQSLDYFPISTWNVGLTTFNYTDTANTGYAVISLASDINGTRGLSIYGWNGRDTYWANAWASQYILGNTTGWLPAGTVSLVLGISYTGSSEPIAFTVVKALGTITEFGTNDFTAAYNFDNRPTLKWSGAVTVPNYPQGYWTMPVWWFAKLGPTSSIASVNYDP